MGNLVEREYNLSIHDEGDGMLWAEVVELPGTFASGADLDELMEAVVEAINMVDPPTPEKKRFHKPSPPMPRPHVREAKVAFV